jgi:outer membrane receptor protein involved in Fe transport
MSGAAIFALGSYAEAQQADTNAGAGTAETVVVTGTRIPRPESDLPIPVTTIGDEQIQHSGTTDLGDYLKRIPALRGSLGNNENSGYNTGASDAGSSLGGLNLLDLRNLGYVRTLVLIDGHRTVSESTGSAAVDINTIPITLIDRVEVVTGGASAIYGADGVSGVVNFVMKHDMDGIKFRAQIGTSNDGGGSSTISALSAGHNFDDDKGNVTFTFESGYQDRLFFTQRPYTRAGNEYFFATNPNDAPSDLPGRPDNKPFKDIQFTYSAVTGAVDLNFDFVPDRLGTDRKYRPGTDVGDSSAIHSSGMPYANDLQGDFQPLERRYVTQLNGHYDFSRYFKLSANLSYSNIFTKSYNIAPFDDFTIVTSQNAFLPDRLAQRIANHGGFAALSEDYLPMRMAEVVKRATYRSVLDASGELPQPSFLDNLKYDVSYVYGQSDIDDAEDNNRLEDRFAAALDSVIDPKTGQATCRSNLNPNAKPPDLSIFDAAQGATIFGPVFSDIQTIGPADWPNNLTFKPGPNSGCVPYNPFDPNYNNNKAIAWATATSHIMGVIMQHVVSGDVTADVPAFQDWGFAGPLAIVAGGEYRKESSQSTPDAFSQGLDAFDGGINGVHGGFDVSEEFAEVNLPVIKDWLFIKEFSLDGAVRHSEYSTAGQSTSWQYSGVLSPFDGLKLRGSQAYAVRAPNIGELFAPVQNLFSAIADPCDRSQVNNGTSFRPANCTAIFHALGLPYNPANAPVLSNGVTTPTASRKRPAPTPRAPSSSRRAGGSPSRWTGTTYPSPTRSKRFPPRPLLTNAWIFRASTTRSAHRSRAVLRPIRPV